MTAKRRFKCDSSYKQEVELGDGQEVTLRLVQPTDKKLLLSGLARMSPQSRYFRFMGARNGFKESALRYLCEVDGINHFAMGAVVKNKDGSEQGVAVARFIRLPNASEVADPAITVVDDYQGKGLGRLLLKRLTRAARERGVRRFRCDFLPSNQKIRSLLGDFEQSAIIQEDNDVVTMDFELPEPSVGELMSEALHNSGMYQAFVEVARGVLPVRVNGPS